MSISVYVPNTDRFSFLLSMYLVLAYATFCVCYFYMRVSADYVAWKWCYSPFVTLILKFKQKTAPTWMMEPDKEIDQ